MTTDAGPGESTTLSAEEAFAVVGNETRLEILQALGEADEPLAYSSLFDSIAYDDTANFTYHLEKLVGHFVRKTEEGYELRLAGRRVVEAVHSGVVTENPVLERTAVDTPCMYCGSPTDIGYHEDLVVLYCGHCDNGIERARDAAERWPIPATDIVGFVGLPPAGARDRTADELFEAAGIWTVADIHSWARGVCPRCSAPVERTPRVCETHDGEDGFCDRCGHQFGVTVDVRCTNCIYETRSPYPAQALGTTELTAFMTDHGIDPFVSDGFHLRACEEEIVSTDPLEARYTFTADGDALTLTVDEELSVVDGTRERLAEADR